MKFLKTIDLFLIIFFIISISGCVFNPDERTISSIKDMAHDVNEQMLHAIEYKNAEELKSLFCQKLLNNYTHLDEDISEAFQFIKGDIISFGNTVYGEQSSMREYEWTEYRVTPRIRKVKTSEEKEYSILYYNILVYDEEPERIGISEIMITDTEDDSKFIIGDYYIVNPEAKH